MQDFAKAGANMFTFHLEAVAEPSQLSQAEAHPAVVDVAQQVRAAGEPAGQHTAGPWQVGPALQRAGTMFTPPTISGS